MRNHRNRTGNIEFFFLKKNITFQFWYFYKNVGEKVSFPMSVIPVRCFSCGAVVANKWESYLRHMRDGTTSKEALRLVNIKRYCCAR